MSQADSAALLYTEPPFVWPDPRELAGVSSPDPAADAALWAEARTAFVVTTDIDDEGVTRLTELLTRNDALTVRAVVVIYPTSATREDHLRRLIRLQEKSGDKFAVHLLLKEWDQQPAANVILTYGDGGSSPLLRFGTTPNVECARPLGPWHANLVFHPDPRLTDSLRRWFDYAWLRGADLTEQTAKVPHLLRPQGTREASALWEQYREFCQGESLFAENQPPLVSVNPTTGEATATDVATGVSVAAPSAELNLPKVDRVAQAVMSLLARGTLVGVDRASRAKPLDMPISARLFGLTAQQQHGRVTVERSFRISVLNEKDLKELERYRKRIGLLVDKFTAPLGDGLNWMPASARKPFEQMVEEQNAAGMDRFKEILGGNPAAFVDGQKERLRADADEAFRAATGSGRKLSEGQFETILLSLKERLRAVLDKGRVLPSVTHMGITLDLSGAKDDDPRWNQALSLLLDLAVKQREAISSPFFWREFAPKPQENYLTAMNALGDYICGVAGTVPVAQRELEWLMTLRDAFEVSARERCIAVLEMVSGMSGPAEDIVWRVQVKA